jgi:hypothetical protein
MVLSTDLQRHTWNRLIEDFIGAVRNDDKDHESYPSVPTLAYPPKKSSMPPAIEQHWTLGDRGRIKERRSVDAYGKGGTPLRSVALGSAVLLA